MSIGEGGRLSASSSGLGSLGSLSGRPGQSVRTKIVSGRELYRENTTAWKPCHETCGYCQLECPNCSSYAALSVQRIDGKIQQVWTIVNKSTASTKHTVNQVTSDAGNELAGIHSNNQHTYTSLGNVSTLCSRRALHLTPCKDCARFDASAPPLSRPHSSDSGLFDLSEGKPVPFDKRASFEKVTGCSSSPSRVRRKNKVSPSPSDPIGMSEVKEDSAEKENGDSAEGSLKTEVLPASNEGESSPENASASETGPQENETTVVEETKDENVNEDSGEPPPSKERVTNPFEEGYEDPAIEDSSKTRSHKYGPNPFEDDDDTNPFNTDSPTTSRHSCSSANAENSKKSISPSTRPSSSILDVRKLLHPDKVYPIDMDGKTKISDSGSDGTNSPYDPEANVRQPSIVSSTGPTVFSKTALFLKQMLVGAAVIIMVGVVVMFIASLGKSMMK